MTKKSAQTVQVKARMRVDLQRKLEREAEKRGLTTNAEILRRLEASFDYEKALGGAEAVAIFHTLAGRIASLKAKLGPHWQDHPEKAIVLTRGLMDAFAQALPNIKWIRVALGDGEEESFVTSYSSDEAMREHQSLPGTEG